MTGRDRLRELLDAVLDEENPRLDDMAADAFASSFHFSREVSRGTGESPVALRRRVMLERAAWRIAGGMSITDAAWEAGYDSLEGFSRAFAKSYAAPPSAFSSRGDVRAHWLAAPNGVHFHPPLNLWVHDAEETSLMHVAAQLFQHDLDDTTHLIEVVAGIPDADYRAEVLPGQTVLTWDGAEPSAAKVLDHHIWSKEVWTASFAGADFPDHGPDDPASLRARHEAIAPRWLEVVRDVERRNAWDDRLIDALCEPPESFQIGSVLAHVLTFGAHRRQLVRLMLRASGHEIDHGDPITWLRERNEA
jgi:AraC family transcriptional regulator